MLLTKDQLEKARHGSYVRLVEMYEQLAKNPEANKEKMQKAGAALLKSIGQDQPAPVSDDKVREKEVDDEIERRCIPIVDQYNNGQITSAQLIEQYRTITSDVMRTDEVLKREVSDDRIRALRQLRSRGGQIPKIHSKRMQRDMAVITHEAQRDTIEDGVLVWHVDEIIKYLTDHTPENRIDVEAIICKVKEVLDGELV